MSLTLATILGLDQSTALLLITVIATAATAGAMLAVVFFAWAPYLSRDWATEFGALRRRDETASERPSD